VPGRLLSALQAAAWEEGAWLHLVEEEVAKPDLHRSKNRASRLYASALRKIPFDFLNKAR
jgi:hypothetical protein